MRAPPIWGLPISKSHSALNTQRVGAQSGNNVCTARATFPRPFYYRYPMRRTTCTQEPGHGARSFATDLMRDCVVAFPQLVLPLSVVGHIVRSNLSLTNHFSTPRSATGRSSIFHQAALYTVPISTRLYKRHSLSKRKANYKSGLFDSWFCRFFNQLLYPRSDEIFSTIAEYVLNLFFSTPKEHNECWIIDSENCFPLDFGKKWKKRLKTRA